MENEKRYHSVRLDKSRCRGCTNCLKRCPTEAIRIHSGRAHIMDERCIDCGECIRICTYHAKLAVTDGLVHSVGHFQKRELAIEPKICHLYCPILGLGNV